MPKSKEAVAAAKTQQDYDPDPPRCFNCVYHRHEPERKYVEREIRTRKGKVKKILVRVKSNPHLNPMVHRCTFGDFIVQLSGICNEWHSRKGEILISETDDGRVGSQTSETSAG